MFKFKKFMLVFIVSVVSTLYIGIVFATKSKSTMIANFENVQIADKTTPINQLDDTSRKAAEDFFTDLITRDTDDKDKQVNIARSRPNVFLTYPDYIPHCTLQGIAYYFATCYEENLFNLKNGPQRAAMLRETFLLKDYKLESQQEELISKAVNYARSNFGPSCYGKAMLPDTQTAISITTPINQLDDTSRKAAEDFFTNLIIRDTDDKDKQVNIARSRPNVFLTYPDYIPHCTLQGIAYYFATCYEENLFNLKNGPQRAAMLRKIFLLKDYKLESQQEELISKAVNYARSNFGPSRYGKIKFTGTQTAVSLTAPINQLDDTSRKAAQEFFENMMKADSYELVAHTRPSVFCTHLDYIPHCTLQGIAYYFATCYEENLFNLKNGPQRAAMLRKIFLLKDYKLESQQEELISKAVNYARSNFGPSRYGKIKFTGTQTAVNPIEQLVKERDKLILMYRYAQNDMARLNQEYASISSNLGITEDLMINDTEVPSLDVDVSAERSSNVDGLKAQIEEISARYEVLIRICNIMQWIINVRRQQYDDQPPEEKIEFENKGIILPVASEIFVGEELQLAADVRGDAEGLHYEFICEKDGQSEVTKMNSDAYSAVCTWVPKEAGKYILTLTVSDDDGVKKTASVTCEVKEKSTSAKSNPNTQVKQPVPASTPTKSEAQSPQSVQSKPTISVAQSAVDSSKPPVDHETTIDELVELDGGNARYAREAKIILSNLETGNAQGTSGLGDIAAKVNEVCVRIKNEDGKKAHPVQVLTALRLADGILNGSNKGSVAQVKTGEGKSMIIAIVAIVLVQSKKTVDIVTSTTDLAKRDQRNQAKYYDMFGIGSGVLYSKDSDRDYESNGEEKEGFSVGALRNPILYSTNSNLEFLHLCSVFRNTSLREEDYQRPYDVVIVDEVDNMLLDQASSPAIISNEIDVKDAGKIIKDVYSMRNSTEEEILEVIKKKYKKSSEHINLEIIEMMKRAALYAYSQVRDKDYVVLDGEKGEKIVEIFDFSTGHSKPGSRWENYIHEMVEVKEGLPVRAPSYSFCTISQKAFFKLYNKIAGVTGTIGGERDAGLLRRTYNVNIFKMARNLPSKQEVFYRDRGEEVESAFGDIKAQIDEMTAIGRPVLVIFSSKKLVDAFCTVYAISEDSKILGIYPKTDEAAIAHAGEAGAVTIATNAAGRGMDIGISKEVEARGGLHVIIAEWPESERVLCQAMGRSARQGQRGSVCIYQSPNDVYVETPDFDERQEYLTELQYMFASHSRSIWPWLYETAHENGIEIEVPLGAEVHDIMEASLIPFTNYVFDMNVREDLNKIDKCTDLLYYIIMQAWGSFFTYVSEHIEEYTSVRDLEKDYRDFLEDLYEWVPENSSMAAGAIGHLVNEGMISIVEHMSGAMLRFFDWLYGDLIPEECRPVLDDLYVPQILKVVGGVGQIAVGAKKCATGVGAITGIPMMLLGLNVVIEAIQEIYHKEVGDGEESANPLKEMTGHKLDKTIDLATLCSDGAAAKAIISKLQSIRATKKLAKAEETYESAKKKLQEELKKLKGGKNLTAAELRQIEKVARNEARHALAKNSPRKWLRKMKPNKPAPEIGAKPKLKAKIPESVEIGSGAAESAEAACIEISDKKMWQIGDHFEKHGRSMGYSSKQEYDMAAREFAKTMQSDSKTMIFEGKWNGRGQLNGSVQRVITNNERTVIIDAETGQIIDFYVGNDYGGLIDLKRIK